MTLSVLAKYPTHMRTAGLILDIYDDPQAHVLLNALGGDTLSEKLASSRLLDVSDLERVPDRLFGLVAANGDQVIRKYAMHDEPHLITSLVYFIECGHKLPEEAQKVAASNLVNACAWYDVTPPEDLVKVAVLGAAMTAAGGVMIANEEADKHRLRMDKFRSQQTEGSKVSSGEEVELSPAQDKALQNSAHAGTCEQAGHVAESCGRQSRPDKAMARVEKEEPGILSGDLSISDIVKKSDLNGTEIMPMGVSKRSPFRASPGKAAPHNTKVGGWEMGPDVTGMEPPKVAVNETYTHFASPHTGMYPIDTAGQVKQAEAYFDSYYKEMEPLDRRIFAQSLLDRADTLGTKVAGAALEYGGDGYGPHIHGELVSRINGFGGTEHAAGYTALLEKKASIPPSAMAELLGDFDKVSGAAGTYGRPGVGVRDPYQAVYGMAKCAEEAPPKEVTYSWKSTDGEYVTGMMLQSLADQTPTSLDDTFGEGFTKSFTKDPVGIFESMPDPQKALLARLASDNSGGTYRT